MLQPNNPPFARRALLGSAVAIGVGATLSPAILARADVVPGDPAGRPVDQESIDAVAAQFDRALIALRRHIHRHPELAGAERRTAATVASRLRAAGLRVTVGVGGHGVVGVLQGAHPGPTVAYRADMDAVPSADQIGGGPEPAHLCGHDLHTVVGVGVAQILARLRHRLSGKLVFLFQPAEENLTGARAMLDDRVLERTRPQEIHALHCGPFPVGQFAVTPGTGLPGHDHAAITLTGPAPADQARQLTTEINALATVAIPQTPADFEQLVYDIQTPDGPLARFVAIRAQAGETDAEGRAKVEASYKCWPEERYVEIRDTIRRLAQPYAGSQLSFSAAPFPAMLCPPQEGHALKGHLRRVLGPNAVTVLQAAVPFNGEDYALFLDRIPGTYTFLGVRAPGADITTCYPHLGTFDPDERAIGIGVRAMAGWLAQRTSTP
ncbi:M20 metallopeptidase family protein [Actinomadura madurae]|uniref:M20 metallopeptidase family protein n=1 Tax=Actinomadura madurae TaxID=1993 RepID=UPI002025FFC7|nr:M20/M25/M40 family metallo-hydrolase [Actinomadura madurae]MCP9953594.1 M20/M25/M40 family metallo-hydrolase [Actinomadura madurae]MCP9970352.1 M20/M25/M40 family metallo-hydrolase [Actinomadura madurae]MCP9982831.1 M20/M25/M40 family metallo-hydrolase [Actinomadura madurae]MCQ0019066.1 M20/M25/M40 family metallo-hydrolase [Actinomadura madurae]URN09764.1 M20/M25/M40 family metallo-hydrolase [Actinomadura madurae]